MAQPLEHRIPKGRPPRHRMQHGLGTWKHLSRRVWTRHGTVGSTRAASPPVQPGPAEVLRATTPNSYNQQSPDSRASTSSPQSLHPGPEGQAPLALPTTLRARPAGARKRCVRLAESIHTYIPVPHPRACSSLSTPLESRAPQHVRHTRPSSQSRAPQPYPDPREHTARNKPSASRRLSDSDRRQPVRDTFALP